ncbi:MULTISPECIES: WGR domain-containing protein [Bradyrhizobium]|uniref:WGR domain-containing protein n=1 Tax=Bradyrhizobium TaxID=374 RepID=UPI00352F6D73
MSELTVQYLVLERRDPARNMARFYVLTIEPTLFGDTALVREWGRLGGRGRRRLDLFKPSRLLSPGSGATPVAVTSSGTFRARSRRATRHKSADLDKMSVEVYQSNPRSYSTIFQELRKYSIINYANLNSVMVSVGEINRTP